MMTAEMARVLTSSGGFGWIPPGQRTAAQLAAQSAARMRCYVTTPIPRITLAPGDKVLLCSAFNDPGVIADMGGKLFTGFHQFTGSCVGVSGGDIAAMLAALQRLDPINPQKAIVPFWAYDYGRTRAQEGDHGQGEGAIDSVLFDVMIHLGVLDYMEPGLPQFNIGEDGWELTEQLEMQWSDGNSSTVTKWADAAKKYPLGAAIVCGSLDNAQTLLAAGNPLLGGCGQYVGHGSIRGSGDDAHVFGKMDGSGGHSTGVLGVWMNKTFGRLWLYSNQWPTSTYPKDPAGGMRCTCWMDDSSMSTWLSGGEGEAAGLSRLKTVPVDPAYVNWTP